MSAPSNSKWRRPAAIITAVAIVGIGLYIFWPPSKVSARNQPSKQAAEQKGGRGGEEGAPTPVLAIRARTGNIGVYFTGLGSVTPISTVTVRSRVDGELVAIHYREGDMVRKGDLLIEIDPRPYQAQLTQLEGQLQRDQASLENARTDLTRYEMLIKQNAIPEQQLATQRATVEQDEGIVKSDEGQIEGVKLNLTYCRITAPLTGRVGLRLVDAGNIVHAADANGLVVITQIDPISVLFTLAEDQLPQVLQKLRGGRTLPVEGFDREMKNKLAQGTLTTVDNEIDQTTGTARIRAVFDNRDNKLFPNQFVNARLLVEQKRNVVLLSSAAIQRTSNSTFVYQVKPDATVTIRNVTVGTTEGDDSEIASGLAAGDVVVETGADKLQEGSHVSVQFTDQRGGQRK
jgi:multidrug efflux system membrane fusion protein